MLFLEELYGTGVRGMPWGRLERSPSGPQCDSKWDRVGCLNIHVRVCVCVCVSALERDDWAAATSYNSCELPSFRVTPPPHTPSYFTGFVSEVYLGYCLPPISLALQESLACSKTYHRMASCRPSSILPAQWDFWRVLPNSLTSTHLTSASALAVRCSVT